MFFEQKRTTCSNNSLDVFSSMLYVALLCLFVTTKTFTITIAYMYIVTSRGPMHQDSEKYWFGLKSDISNNVNNTFDFFWTGCEDSTFLTPLAPDFDPQNETCVYMWVNREVFVGVYQEKWYYGQDCLSEAPFVCSVHVPGESRIALFTCTKIIYIHMEIS